MGKYGTNLEGFGGFEGGVNADKGAPLVGTSSDGATSLLFGPAALREIQAGVANGDFAIPPDAAGDTITEENPLPYWTFTDASSGIIVPTVVASASTAMGNALRFTIAATTTGKIATFTRYIPIAGNANRVYSYIGQLYRVAVSGTAGNKALVKVTLTLTSYSTDLNAGSASATANYTANSATATLTTSAFTPDATAAFILITLQVETTGTTSGTVTIDFSEIRTARGDSLIPITDDANPTWLPALISASSGTLTITAPTNNAGTWTDAVTVKAPNFSRGLYVEEGMSGSGTGTNTLYFGDNSSSDTIKILAQNTTASQNYTGDIYSSGVRILGWQGNTIAGAAVTPKVFLYVKTEATADITTTGNIGFGGAIYGTTALTGPNIDLAGTNTRLWTVSGSAADLAASTAGATSGILITKSVAGQPTTNINGTGTTDAFADALRNGGIASDNTNGRFYVYNGGAWKYAALTTPSDSRLKEEITEITGALDTLRQLMPVAFKWKRPEAHPRTDAVADDGKRLGFIADQVATTDLKRWVEDMGVSELESDLIDTDGRVLAVNIPQNEMEALVVQALLDIDTRLKALEAR
jgi:hypothetical protein